MQDLECPRCRAGFHTGVLSAPLETCPRCGAPFPQPRSDGEARPGIFGNRAAIDAPDWETVAGAEYAGTQLARDWHRAAG
jgi:hypothetical protein